MLANFADNIFAMGPSRLSSDLRYLKHLKLRNAAIKHDASCVCTLRLGKMPGVAPHPAQQKLRAKHHNVGGEERVSSPHVSKGLTSDSPSPLLLHSSSQNEAPASFLGFEHVGYDRERDHIGWLGSRTDAVREEMIKRAETLAAAGRSQRTIAKSLGLSTATVNRYLRSGRQNDHE